MVQLLHLLHQRIVSPSMVETLGCKMGFVEVMSRCQRTAKQSHVAIYVSCRFNENALDAGLMWNVSTRGVPSWFWLHFTRHIEPSNREHIRDPGWCDDEKRKPCFARWSKERREFRGCSRGKSKLTEIGPVWNMNHGCYCLHLYVCCFVLFHFLWSICVCKCWSRDETIFHQP